MIFVKVWDRTVAGIRRAWPVVRRIVPLAWWLIMISVIAYLVITADYLAAICWLLMVIVVLLFKIWDQLIDANRALRILRNLTTITRKAPR